jgi:hypothetical protein
MIITARTVTDSGPENNTPPTFGIGGPSRLDQGRGGAVLRIGWVFGLCLMYPPSLALAGSGVARQVSQQFQYS